MEDLAEEIIGEIYDETDRDVQAVVHEPDGSLLLTGPSPSIDYTTIAGLLLARLGHIPTGPGEIVDVGRFGAEVIVVTGHAITKIRLRRATTETPETDRPP
jgi:putative hemolysin